MTDIHFKFEEDRTRTAVAVESDKYLGWTDGQTGKHSSDFITCCAVATELC